MFKHMKFWVQFKLLWSLFFTGTIVIYTLINMVLGITSMEFIVIWQLALITAILTGIHYIIFGEFVLNTLSNTYKMILHFILFYLTILVSSVLAKWVNVSNLYELAIFTLGYISLHLCTCGSFYLYYKVTGEQLNKKLAQYKQNKSRN